MGLRPCTPWLVLGAAVFGGWGVDAMAQGPAVPVEIRRTEGAHTLYRGGEPYAIRGAGVGRAADLESLARFGGNSARTWAAGDGSILERAAELGMTVALCLDLARERHGFDYDDADAVARQFERVRSEVLAYRNHPALLFWIIGNELNHDFRNPRVYDAVNDISRMIHRLDRHHPTTTATAGIDPSLARILEERAPDLDFLSVQLYGGLPGLPAALAHVPSDWPVVVTEWGTIGHWEVPATPWGAPLEPTSTEKARRYREGYGQVLDPLAGRVIGNYAFLWGQKQERTPTWYGVFTADGRRTEAVDVLHHVWTGAWPSNRAPRLRAMLLDGKRARDSVRLVAGAEYVASVEADDPEGDALGFEWTLMRESEARQSGGDAEAVPDRVPFSHSVRGAGKIGMTAPETPGAYRLFVYVGDGNGAVAHANVPFLVVGA